MKVRMFTKDEREDLCVPMTTHHQIFECCGTHLTKVYENGWEWSDGNIIPTEIISKIKYCPFCKAEIKEIEDNLDKTLW